MSTSTTRSIKLLLFSLVKKSLHWDQRLLNQRDPKLEAQGVKVLYHKLPEHPSCANCVGSGGSSADMEKLTREAKFPPQKSSMMHVFCRPGMMVGDVDIDMGSLISIGMMEPQRGRAHWAGHHHQGHSGHTHYRGQQKQSGTQNVAQSPWGIITGD